MNDSKENFSTLAEAVEASDASPIVVTLPHETARLTIAEYERKLAQERLDKLVGFIEKACVFIHLEDDEKRIIHKDYKGAWRITGEPNVSYDSFLTLAHHHNLL